MTYQFDYFVSYPAKCGAGDWVNNYFIPVLRQSFQDELKPTPSIYNFSEREIATDWPLEVSSALHTSKFMIAVLTPPYFYESIWCPAEWATMLEREKLVTFPERPHQRLIIPVVYSDGEHFPDEAKDIRHKDMRDFAYPDPAFGASADFMKFRTEMRKFARSIGEMLPYAPPWDANWPTLHRPPSPKIKLSLPRLG